ncbi:MAG TPA: hypothetical protein VMM18_09615 [Gemmatimonadaceae bacterium]|nr:hypothetical protein [Gemmatimonadaceae bacterium]
MALAVSIVAWGAASAEAARLGEPGPATTTTGATPAHAVRDTTTRSTQSVPSLMRGGEQAPRRLVYYGRLGMPFVPRGIIVFSSVPIIEPVIVRRLDTTCQLDESGPATSVEKSAKRRPAGAGRD